MYKSTQLYACVQQHMFKNIKSSDFYNIQKNNNQMSLNKLWYSLSME